MSIQDNYWKIERYSDTRAEWKIAAARTARLNRKADQARRLSDALYEQMEAQRKEATNES